MWRKDCYTNFNSNDTTGPRFRTVVTFFSSLADSSYGAVHLGTATFVCNRQSGGYLFFQTLTLMECGILPNRLRGKCKKCTSDVCLWKADSWNSARFPGANISRARSSWNSWPFVYSFGEDSLRVETSLSFIGVPSRNRLHFWHFKEEHAVSKPWSPLGCRLSGYRNTECIDRWMLIGGTTDAQSQVKKFSSRVYKSHPENVGRAFDGWWMMQPRSNIWTQFFTYGFFFRPEGRKEPVYGRNNNTQFCSL